ncbi:MULTISPECIES: cytochrome c [unclassified Yoonia]|uniref:c-type cytochrome n=1 Tax=unclassified Yoonia TaxID=2629118 RepID=UPI002AFECA28|nr:MULTISPECIES: cytochrome c [unclassified Yoonia]
MRRFTLLATTLCLSATALLAQDLTEDQDRALTARQAHMGLYGFYLTPLGQMAQDRIPYDAEVAAAAANNLAAMAAIDQSAFWVEGTDSTLERSRARAEIWTDPEGYLEVKQDMETATAALAMVAGDGLDALKGAFGPVGQSCGACHETYRAPAN